MALRRRKEEEWDGTERRRPPTVLVVNDDRDACEVLVRFLGRAGFYTSGAHSDVEATAEVHRKLPRCVVLDMAGGGIGSNLQVLDHLRSHDDRRISSTRVVLCAPTTKGRGFSFQSGADAFLVHPFHIDELIVAVNDVLGRPDTERSRHRRHELERHGDL